MAKERASRTNSGISPKPSSRRLVLLIFLNLEIITSHQKKKKTPKGHMLPEALIAGFKGHSCETVNTDSIPTRYKFVCKNQSVNLGLALNHAGRGHHVHFNIEKDLVWLWDCVLPRQPNGWFDLLFIFFPQQFGEICSNNTNFSIGGGSIGNTKTQFSGKNLYYKQISKRKATPSNNSSPLPTRCHPCLVNIMQIIHVCIALKSENEI
ncbi:hypothetical protein VP01_552g5 [Puccinia sorghi]|uniref:Serine dehydratase beta chain domain-containing protein n=1 Tax=Puccinia sorghi TaxID=27349 RepID=A0A0L6UJ95_9BASI|nr:hypothetical protein VP01_552g5 [Puccinia sorghi]